MAVRTSMSELITHLRLLIDDPSGATALFTDQQLQDVLDQNSTLAMYEQLTPLHSIASGGVVEYKKFNAEHIYWETDTIITDADYDTLTATSVDYKAGLWTFATAQELPILVYGNWYDMMSAAADGWDLKAAIYAGRFDFSADGGTYSQSKQYDQALAIAKQFRAKSLKSNGIVYLRRTDVIS